MYNSLCSVRVDNPYEALNQFIIGWEFGYGDEFPLPGDIIKNDKTGECYMLQYDIDYPLLPATVVKIKDNRFLNVQFSNN